MFLTKNNLNIKLIDLDNESNVSLEIDEEQIIIRNIFKSKFLTFYMIKIDDFMNYMNNILFQEKIEKKELIIQIKIMLDKINKSPLLNKQSRFEEAIKLFTLIFNNKYIIKEIDEFRKVVKAKLVSLFLDTNGFQNKNQLIYLYLAIFHIELLEKKIPIKNTTEDSNNEFENSNLDYYLDNC